MNYYNTPFYQGVPQQSAPNFSQMRPVQQPIYPVYAPPVNTGEDNIGTGGFKFTVYKDEQRQARPTDLIIEEDGTTVEAPKRKRGRPRKSETTVSTGLITDGSSSEPANVPTMQTYYENTMALQSIAVQIDGLMRDVQTDLDQVRANRTMRNKYGIIGNLNENIATLINAKITAIKEINNSISKSNEMDYKREKDLKAAQGSQNDDKYIMDMYNAFIQNPVGAKNPLGPTAIDATLLGSSGIIRAATDQPTQPVGFSPDNGYLSYVANMTPEQKLMTLEDNPNIKQVVVYDAATNNKVFQVMDMSTGQVINGVPVRDQMFMEGTTIDLKNRIAKNIDLNEIYPLVVINENVVNEY
ncbi:MAG: hypothetical protein NC548_15835 [Lachnospiraceae bacterium]|nr:hypothetical protein [Lachnospiraceae bacterium]